MPIRKAESLQGQPPVYTGLWSDEKPHASEGAILNIIDSAFYPVLASEQWVFHGGMWTFIPTGDGIL